MISRATKMKDITGQRFGRLTTQWPSGIKDGRVHWLCICDCGVFKVINSCNLGRSTSSCGCFRRECVKATHTTHGQRIRDGRKRSPEYVSYGSAKQRCSDSNCKDYPRYGGCGIKFLFSSFEEFLSEVGPKPSPQHSLDRIDSTGNYEKGNVRWATAKEQARNKRKSVGWNNVREIRQEWASRGQGLHRTQLSSIRKQLADKHGLSVSNVNCIIGRKIWWPDPQDQDLKAA